MNKYILSLARLTALVNGILLVWAVCRDDTTAVMWHMGVWLALALLAAVAIVRSKDSE